jgi:formate-dependent nitrite reductase membrane component NrfD
MLFGESWSSILFSLFILFAIVTWCVVKLFNRIDNEGIVKKAAKEKFISTMTRWLS